VLDLLRKGETEDVARFIPLAIEREAELFIGSFSKLSSEPFCVTLKLKLEWMMARSCLMTFLRP
jgi:hypothetical protein